MLSRKLLLTCRVSPSDRRPPARPAWTETTSTTTTTTTVPESSPVPQLGGPVDTQRTAARLLRGRQPCEGRREKRYNSEEQPCVELLDHQERKREKGHNSEKQPCVELPDQGGRREKRQVKRENHEEKKTSLVNSSPSSPISSESSLSFSSRESPELGPEGRREKREPRREERQPQREERQPQREERQPKRTPTHEAKNSQVNSSPSSSLSSEPSLTFSSPVRGNRFWLVQHSQCPAVSLCRVLSLPSYKRPASCVYPRSGSLESPEQSSSTSSGFPASFKLVESGVAECQSSSSTTDALLNLDPLSDCCARSTTPCPSSSSLRSSTSSCESSQVYFLSSVPTSAALSLTTNTVTAARFAESERGRGGGGRGGVEEEEEEEPPPCVLVFSLLGWNEAGIVADRKFGGEGRRGGGGEGERGRKQSCNYSCLAVTPVVCGRGSHASSGPSSSRGSCSSSSISSSSRKERTGDCCLDFDSTACASSSVPSRQGAVLWPYSERSSPNPHGSQSHHHHHQGGSPRNPQGSQPVHLSLSSHPPAGSLPSPRGDSDTDAQVDSMSSSDLDHCEDLQSF